MAKCKICGEAVKAAPVLCPRCREALLDEFCFHYCRFMRMNMDEDALLDTCKACPLTKF